MQGLAVRQVECGLNLTVALTTDGRTWQMGETGAPGHKLAPWEGAREPQQVTNNPALGLPCNSLPFLQPRSTILRLFLTDVLGLKESECSGLALCIYGTRDRGPVGRAGKLRQRCCCNAPELNVAWIGVYER